MRVILIDPFARTVTELDADLSSYGNLYPLLSHETMPVDCFTIGCRFDNNDDLFVDDEGLLKPCDAFFMVRGYPNPLAGKGLIVGADDEGTSVDAKSSLADIAKAVTFFSREEVVMHAAKTGQRFA